MFNLLLAILCSLAIGVIFKLARRLAIDRVGLLTVNYLSAVVLSLSIGVDFSLSGGGSDLAALLIVGLVNGLLFVVGFGLYAVAIDQIGLAISAATMRIAVLVPFAASWIVWREIPGALQVPGLGVAIVAFVLMAFPPPRRAAASDGSRHPYAVLLTLFLVAGTADTALKVFDEHLASFASRSTYLLLAFGGAFGAGVMWMLTSPRRLSMRLSARTCAGGIVLGVINYGSAEFFLRALEELPGTLAYPVNHVAVLLGGTLLGVVIWRESLSRLNRWGLALAATSLVLLTV